MDDFNDSHFYSLTLFYNSPKYGTLNKEFLQQSDFAICAHTILLTWKFHNFIILLSAPYSHTYATNLLLFQFSPRPLTTIYTLPLPISYFSLHHHITLSTLLLQNPLELHPRHSTATTFSYPNLLYITSFTVQHFVYWFYLLCTSLNIFTIWRDF